MTKFTAILKLISGVSFALIGLFTLCRAIGYVSAAPSGQEDMTAWACMIVAVGVCLVIGGVRYARDGASAFQEPEMPEDF
jgi:hypothetical protein